MSGGGKILDEEDVEVEMALLSLLASRDVGDPTEPVDLHALSPTEKKVLLQMMRSHIGFVEPTPLRKGRAREFCRRGSRQSL